MAVAFDAVGPSSAGVSSVSSLTLTWTHTNVASGVAVLAAVSVDNNPDTMTCTATCGGTPMTSLGVVHSNATNQGYLQVFGLANVGSGAKTITVTATSAPSDMEGGSLSFSGADTSSPFAAAQSANTPQSASATTTTTGSTAGNMTAGFAAAGDTVSSPSAGTSRYIKNQTGNSGFGTGNTAGATQAGTGSGVAFTWALGSSTFWAVIAVEVLVPAAANTNAPAGVASVASGVPQPSLLSGPLYATAAADLGGGSGSWVNPGNADGAPDSSYSTWAVP